MTEQQAIKWLILQGSSIPRSVKRMLGDKFPWLLEKSSWGEFPGSLAARMLYVGGVINRRFAFAPIVGEAWSGKTVTNAGLMDWAEFIAADEDVVVESLDAMPGSTWIRDLTLEGVEPNPGPVMSSCMAEVSKRPSILSFTEGNSSIEDTMFDVANANIMTDMHSVNIGVYSVDAHLNQSFATESETVQTSKAQLMPPAASIWTLNGWGDRPIDPVRITGIYFLVFQYSVKKEQSGAIVPTRLRYVNGRVYWSDGVMEKLTADTFRDLLPRMTPQGWPPNDDELDWWVNVDYTEPLSWPNSRRVRAGGECWKDVDYPSLPAIPGRTTKLLHRAGETERFGGLPFFRYALATHATSGVPCPVTAVAASIVQPIRQFVYPHHE